MDLTRDQLFSLDLQARIAVEIPELGGTLYIKRMSGTEGFEYGKAANALDDSEDGRDRALLLVYTVCDSAGTRLFTEADIPTLMQLPFALLLPLFLQASHLNGLDVPVAEMKKNSLPSRNGSAGIDSHAPLA